MQAEPAEIRLNVSSQGQLRSRNSFAISQANASDVAPSAIDEAFAALSDSTNRVDSLRPQADHDKHEKKDAGEMIRKNQALVASMVSQLETLDRQRQQLADLLDAVEVDSSKQ